jgi:large subunit ribosomal protein L29
MLAKELRLKNAEELRRLADELRADLHTAEFKVATNQLSKVRNLRTIRRDLARVLTVLAQTPVTN